MRSFLFLLTDIMVQLIIDVRKTAVFFVYTVPAYDTVWHCGFNCKLLRLLSDKYMVCIMMELAHNKNSPFPPVTADLSGYDSEKSFHSGIDPEPPFYQHLHLRPASHHFREVH